MIRATIADAFDRVVREGTAQRQREELRAALSARGLSEAELRRVAPYVDYVVRYEGVLRVLPALFLPTLVAGLAAALVVPDGAALALALTGAGTLALGVVARRFYRRAQRARRIRRELLADPEPFLDGDPPRYLIGA